MAWRIFPCSTVFLVCLAGLACAGQEEEVLGRKRSEWLTILKGHKEAKFRRAAVIALEVIGPRASGVLDGLFDAVASDGNPEVRREIALTLGRMGAEAKGAAGVLGDVLKMDKAGEVREAAALSLAGKLNDQAYMQVFILAAAMKDAHPGTRTAAAEALKNLGDKARLALPQLTAVAKDMKADRHPRLFAIQVISKWGDDSTLPALIAIVERTGDAPAVRQGAVEGLGRMGDKAESALGVLTRTLKDKDLELRRAAAVALGQVGTRTKEAWPAIKEAYLDADDAVRNQVLRLAGSLGKEQKEAIALLVGAAEKDVNLENRLAALQELGQLQSSALDALPMLSRLAADDPRGSIREAAKAAVDKIKMKS